MLSRLVVHFLQQHKQDERTLALDFFLILKLGLYTVPVLVLLTLQSDLGTALVFVAIYGGIVLLSGVSWKIILPVFLTGVLLLGGFLFIFISDGGRAFLHNLGMPTYQINRILAWLHPFDYAQTTTFQQAQGQIAVGSGGLTGQGFNVSNLLVPVRESDMIFTVIAEDFGFLGSTLVIMMLLFHIFENIGAVTGILPLTGIPLPFISQGGSSIISNLIGVGLLLSVSYQNSLTDEKKERIPAVRKKVVLKKLR